MLKHRDGNSSSSENNISIDKLNKNSSESYNVEDEYLSSGMFYITEEIRDEKRNVRGSKWYAKLGFTALTAVVFGTVFQLTVTMTGSLFDVIFEDKDSTLAASTQPFEIKTIKPKTNNKDINILEQIKGKLEKQGIIGEVENNQNKNNIPYEEQDPINNEPNNIEPEENELIIYENPVTKVVENVLPSIVTITSYTTAIDWFDNTYENKGTGSGIIICHDDKELLIVTNHHVIEGVNKLQVTFNDKTCIEALVKGSDEETDLAVISVRLSDLSESTLNDIKIAALGNSEVLKIGETAIAIGNPQGYGQTVTLGVISTLSREVKLLDRYIKLIQTDATINAINSGGALVNDKGEVIGINVVKSELNDGMGIAIPIEIAKPIINNLILQKPQPLLGIHGHNITNDIALEYSLPVGIYIVKPQPGTPAYRCGIEAGDILIDINGNKVKTMKDFEVELGKYLPEDIVKVKVLRRTKANFKEIEMEVKLGSK